MAEAPITVLLLGSFAAKNGGGGELLLPKKAQALLAYLIVNRGRRISRDELSALLWSNSGSEQARQSLRQCLSVLRRALHPLIANCLTVHADTLSFAAHGTLANDVMKLEQLEQSAERRELECADVLFNGEFSPDWFCRMSPLRIGCLLSASGFCQSDCGY